MNKSILIKLWHSLLILMNVSLIFHASMDSNFDSIENEYKAKHDIRFSLFYLPLGGVRFYFITFLIEPSNTPHTFKFFHLITFEETQNTLTVSEIENRTETYRKNTLLGATENERMQQEEYLKLKISENQIFLSNIFNKAMYHTTIITAFAAVLGYTFSKFLEANIASPLHYLIWYLIVITLFEAINLICFLKKSVEIRGTYRATFKDLRESNKSYALTKSLYFDWQSTNQDRDYYAGLARNSEQTSLRIIVLGLITLSLVMLSSLSKDISLPYQQEKTIISTPPQGFYTI
ncbi:MULTISPECIES: hypothetical protein [Citrobacter]|uniref:hypothetical protein n=1 Tax=Citrobacter TaxID=544 RepID=UPI000FD84744|nr:MULTISPECIES: hypothetical protein [Citrobacter]ELK6101646.1 hypothetical protein [Citrobacter freundii]MDM3197587.1 hypothetical protein [Citrobacter sp. Cf095]RVR93318.1 hypothetical protein EOL15_29480 [Citrobacter freundii]